MQPEHNPPIAAPGAGPPLLVTTSWDDGHPSDLRVAELLEKHGMAGTFYVPCRNSEGRPVMPPAAIARLGRRFEIGGHTRDHIPLTKLAPAAAADQIAANRFWLEDLLGRALGGFAYVRGQRNRTVRELVRAAGYDYARTVTNLMSAPGSDRFELATTVQFFPHSRAAYLRNYLRGGPTRRRAKLLAPLLSDDRLAAKVTKAAETCAGIGGHFHLWGHSWELDAYGLWDELDRCLGRLQQLPARFVTNAGWCAGLTAGAEPAANDRGPCPGGGR